MIKLHFFKMKGLVHTRDQKYLFNLFNEINARV